MDDCTDAEKQSCAEARRLSHDISLAMERSRRKDPTERPGQVLKQTLKNGKLYLVWVRGVLQCEIMRYSDRPVCPAWFYPSGVSAALPLQPDHQWICSDGLSPEVLVKRPYDQPAGSEESDHQRAEIHRLEELCERQQEALNEIREICTGSEGMVPRSAPEAYLQRLVQKIHETAVKVRGEDAPDNVRGEDAPDNVVVLGMWTDQDILPRAFIRRAKAVLAKARGEQ